MGKERGGEAQLPPQDGKAVCEYRGEGRKEGRKEGRWLLLESRTRGKDLVDRDCHRPGRKDEGGGKGPWKRRHSSHGGEAMLDKAKKGKVSQASQPHCKASLVRYLRCCICRSHAWPVWGRSAGLGDSCWLALGPWMSRMNKQTLWLTEGKWLWNCTR